MDLQTKQQKPTMWIFSTVVLLIGLIAVSVFAYTLYQKPTNTGNNTNNNQTPPPPPAAPEPSPIYTLTLVTHPTDAGSYTVSLTDSKTGLTRTVVKKASSAAMSPDGKSIAYVVTTTKGGTYKGDINIYDVKTEKVTSYLTAQALTNGVEWSPTGKYLVLESGTNISRAYTPVEFATKKVMKGFSGSESISQDYKQYYWIDDSNIVFMTLSSVSDTANIPAGSGQLNGIYRIDITTGEITKLIEPKVGKNYYFTGALPEDDSMEIKEYTYKGKVTKLYEMDLETGKLTESE